MSTKTDKIVALTLPPKTVAALKSLKKYDRSMPSLIRSLISRYIKEGGAK